MTTYHDVTVEKTIAKDAQEKAETALASLGLGGSALNSFKTIVIAGQTDVVADAIDDTLTLVAGSGVVLTTSSPDTITIESTVDAGLTQSFGTITVAGQDDVVADDSPDTLTLVGTGLTITTDAATDTITLSPEYGTTAGTSCQGDDSRLSDARTPAAHADSHKSGGSDAIALDELGSPSDTTTLNSSTTAHGLQVKLSGDPLDYSNGVGGWSKPSGLQAFGKVSVSGQSDIIASASPDTITLAGSTGIILNTNPTLKTLSYSVNFGAVSGTVCQGNDGRLINARPPTNHSFNHTGAGIDGLRLDTLADPLDNTNLDSTTGRHGLLPKLSGNANHYLSGIGTFTVLPSKHFISVKDYGALGNNSHDDTANINAAISDMPSTGGRLYFPAGQYIVSSVITLNKPGVYFGDGYATQLIYTAATGACIDITAAYVDFNNFSILHSVTRTDGHATIKCRGSSDRVSYFYISNFSLAISIEATTTTIEHGTLWEGKASSGIGIYIWNTPYDISLCDILMYSTAFSDAGVRIVSAGDVEMSRLSMLRCNYGLDVFATGGLGIASVWATNSFFDTSGFNGIRLYATGAGSAIVRTLFTHVWASSAGTYGMHIHTDSGGLIEGVQVSSGHFFLNGDVGALVEGAGTVEVRFANSAFAQNSGSSAGLWFVDGVNRFMVNSCRAGNTDGLVGSNYGIVVSGTGHDYYMINNNDFSGNVIAGIVDSGTGVHKSVTGNIP